MSELSTKTFGQAAIAAIQEPQTMDVRAFQEAIETNPGIQVLSR